MDEDRKKSYQVRFKSRIEEWEARRVEWAARSRRAEANLRTRLRADELGLREKLEARRGVSWHLERRRSVASYDHYLKARSLSTSEYEATRDQGLSATIHHRFRDSEISFRGQKCNACGAVQFPLQRVCETCFAKDDFEPHRLSDRPGQLVTYTFDYFFPASEPPTTVVMVEADGCRMQVQLADARPEDVRLDLPVAFAFRKIHEAGGKPNYFWKAVSLEEASS